MIDETKADTVRISKKMIDYIEHVKVRYLEEYGVNISLVEISKIIAERAITTKLFN
jgi:hypothetical protein